MFGDERNKHKQLHNRPLIELSVELLLCELYLAFIKSIIIMEVCP